MAHPKWPDFMLCYVRARHLHHLIQDHANKMIADPTVSPPVRAKYVLIHSLAGLDLLNYPHGNLRDFVDDLGEGVTANNTEAEQIASLTKAHGHLGKAIAFMLDAPLDLGELAKAITEIDHAGGGGPPKPQEGLRRARKRS